MFFLSFVNVIICRDLSVVIVGGTTVDTSFVLKLVVKCTHSSQRRVFDNCFDMFKRNAEFV